MPCTTHISMQTSKSENRIEFKQENYAAWYGVVQTYGSNEPESNTRSKNDKEEKHRDRGRWDSERIREKKLLQKSLFFKHNSFRMFSRSCRIFSKLLFQHNIKTHELRKSNRARKDNLKLMNVCVRHSSLLYFGFSLHVFNISTLLFCFLFSSLGFPSFIFSYVFRFCTSSYLSVYLSWMLCCCVAIYKTIHV